MHKQLTKHTLELNFQLQNLRKTKEYGAMTGSVFIQLYNPTLNLFLNGVTVLLTYCGKQKEICGKHLYSHF